MPQGCKNPNILKIELNPKTEHIFKIAVYKGVRSKLHQELKLPKRSIKVFLTALKGCSRVVKGEEMAQTWMENFILELHQQTDYQLLISILRRCHAKALLLIEEDVSPTWQNWSGQLN